MGNTICDRIFVSLASGDSIASHWSSQYQESMSNLASLDYRGRQHALEKIESVVDKEMIKYFQVSSGVRNVPYEVESLAEQERLLPFVDSHTSKRWLLDDGPSILKDLRLLTRDSESNATIVNEINYLTHLYLLFENYKERKRQDDDKNKPNMMVSCLEALKKAADQSTSKKAKDSFVAAVVQVSIDSIAKLADSIQQSNEDSNLIGFIKKCRQITNTFTSEDRADQNDTKLTSCFEKLTNSILIIINKFHGKTISNEMEELTGITIKLVFYLGKVSFHLRFVNYLLEKGLYKNIRFADTFQEIKENGWIFQSKPDMIFYTASIPNGNLGLRDSEFLADHNRLYISQDSTFQVFNRYPDYACYYRDLKIEASNEIGKLFIHQGLPYTYKNKSICAFTPEHLDSTNENTVLPSKTVLADSEDKSDNIFDDLLAKFDWQGYSEVDSWPMSSGDFIVVLTEYTKEEKYIYTLKYFVQDSSSSQAKIIKEVAVNLNGDLNDTLAFKREHRKYQIVFCSGLVVIIDKDNKFKVIDPWTGKLYQQSENILEVNETVNGVDVVRRKLIHVSKNTGQISFSKLNTYSQYVIPTHFYEDVSKRANLRTIFAKPNPENTKATGNFLDYLMTLLRLANAHTDTTFLGERGNDTKKDYIFSPNAIELRPETIEQLIVSFELLKTVEPEEIRIQTQIGLLKILDIHLSTAAHLQNNDKMTAKVLNQEMLAKLRRNIFNLTVPDSLPSFNINAFEELKLNIITNIFLLSSKVKILPDSTALTKLIISEFTVYSHSSITSFISNLFTLNKKCKDESIKKATDALFENLADLVSDEIRKHSAREEIYFDKETPIPDIKSLNVGSNLKAIFTSCIGLGSQVPDCFLQKIIDRKSVV